MYQPRKKKNELRKRKKNTFFVLNAKKRSLSASPRSSCLLPFSQSSIAGFYIFILFAPKNNHVSVLFRETRLVSLITSSNLWVSGGACVISVLAFYGGLPFIVKPESCRAVSSAPLTTPILPPICHTTGPPFRQRNNNTVHTRFRSVQASTLHHITHYPPPVIPPLCRLWLPRTGLALDIMIQLTARGT